MSGYLQRIISHAKAPASGVKPLVGSIYASSTESPGLHSVHEEIAASIPQRSSAPHAPNPLQSEFRPSAATNFVTMQTNPGIESTSGSAESPTSRQRNTTLMPESYEPEHSAESTTRLEAPERGFPNAYANESTAMPEALPSQIIRMSEVAHQLPVQTNPQALMPRQSRPAVMPAIPVAAVSAAPVADEIHINIGRIEVTAVPQPPAQRPAPRTPRRSFNLDEYLRNTDGRAR